MADRSATGAADPLRGSPDAFTLDHAVWASLTGPHHRFAEMRGHAVRYPTEVAPFVALSPDHGAEGWDDLAALVGAGRPVVLAGVAITVPAAWERLAQGEGMQMLGTGLQVAKDPELVELEPSDVPDMLGLIERTRPGPFLPRTIELGHYLGVRREGTLIAMAGERLHPSGWTEISAVCTDPAHRGQGWATRLVRAVGAGIRARGETPFLHAAAANTNAIRLYQQLGFVVRRRLTFQSVRVPGGEPAA